MVNTSSQQRPSPCSVHFNIPSHIRMPYSSRARTHASNSNSPAIPTLPLAAAVARIPQRAVAVPFGAAKRTQADQKGRVRTSALGGAQGYL